MPTYRKKTSIRRKKPSTKTSGVSDSVKKYVKSVTKKTRPEMKYTIALLPSPLTGPEPTLSLVGSVAGYSWTEFGNIAAATGANAVNTRIGQEIYLQGHYSKTTYFNNSPVPIYVRHLIVSLPSQDVEGGTDAAELFTYSGQGVSFTTIGNTTAIMQVPINKTQYRVYSDKTFKLGSTSALDGTCTRMVKNFQKFGGKKIMFESLASGF